MTVDMIRGLWLAGALAAGLQMGFAGGALAADEFIVVQSTTSTANSGLLDAILPEFTEGSGIEVRVVAVGTGQAIKNAINGDGDVLLVHAKPAEEKFVADGWGVQRFDVMYNDFVLVGPEDDPAGIQGGSDIVAALQGETGSGMGATLNAAQGMGAYVLTDRATWISFGNKDGMEIMVEGDERLFNQYGVILVNPEKHPGVKADAGQAFIDWLIGDEGQAAIAGYQVDGQQLFFPNAE